MVAMAFKLSPSTPLISPPPQPIHPSSSRTTNFSISKTTSLPRNLCITSCLKSRTRLSASRTVPARDLVIDFGKFKGRMLGTLPSTYLKWATKNLLTSDFDEWRKLAEEVLNDPVYQDRIEWEFAENILTGNNPAVTRGKSAASELQEISERFGWDFEDEAAWKRIDFALLGTSRGGRLPRAAEKEQKMKEGKGTSSAAGGTTGEDGGKRRERRERMKQRSRREMISSSTGTSFDVGGTIGRSDSSEEEDERGESVVGQVPSRFPGREALLRKAKNRERLT